MTVFFSSHLLDDVDRMCEGLVVIKDGSVKFSGNKSDFVAKSDRSYIIQYQENSQIKMGKAETLEDLQEYIDKVRSDKKEIISIDMEKVSLDKAFKDFQKGSFL